MNPLMRKTLGALLLLTGLLQACGGGHAAQQAGPTADPASPSSPAPSTPTPPTRTPSPTAVGTPLGEAVTAEIGAAGGRLDAPDGSLSLIVPAGAFDRPRRVGLQAISNQAQGGLGGAWRITPEGLDTPVAMTLVWRYTAAEARSTAGLSIAYQGSDRRWRRYRAVAQDPVARSLSIQTRHFSDWSRVAGIQLLPGRAELPAGQSLNLMLSLCSHVAADEFVDLSLDCAPAVFSSPGAGGWAVNGVAGGTAATGSVRDDSDGTRIGQGLYTAPASAPADNPVAVSVAYQQQTLVANITVLDPNAPCAWLKNVQTLAAEIGFDYGFSGADEQLSQRYRQQADVSGSLLLQPLSPIGTLHWQGHLTQGRVMVENASQSLGGPERITVDGSGGPFQDPRLPGLVNVWMNLQSCAISFSAEVMVAARHTQHSGANSWPLEQQLAGGAVHYGERAIAGRREFLGSARLPAIGTLVTPDAYVPMDVHHRFNAPTLGTAEVRWAFRPQ